MSANPDELPTLLEGPAPDIATTVACIAHHGYVVLRGVIAADAVEAVWERTGRMLAQPSVAGQWGYFRADHQKRVLLPTLLGAPVYQLIANECVIDIADAYLNSACVLAETNLKADKGVGYEYFAMHSDFAVGWRKRSDVPSVVTADAMAKPLGLGGAIYLHDTVEGAFTYCAGTHTMGAPHGQRLAAYPKEMRNEILSRRVRVEGKKGDIVLFDDRGFHGPDHPSRTDRTLILVDYYRTDVLGNEQVTPLPIWSCDIGALTDKQLRVLGAHSSYTVPFDQYKWNKIARTAAYRLIRPLVDNAFIWRHIQLKAKALFRR